MKSGRPMAMHAASRCTCRQLTGTQPPPRPTDSLACAAVRYARATAIRTELDLPLHQLQPVLHIGWFAILHWFGSPHLVTWFMHGRSRNLLAGSSLVGCNCPTDRPESISIQRSCNSWAPRSVLCLQVWYVVCVSLRIHALSGSTSGAVAVRRCTLWLSMPRH